MAKIVLKLAKLHSIDLYLKTTYRLNFFLIISDSFSNHSIADYPGKLSDCLYWHVNFESLIYLKLYNLLILTKNTNKSKTI